MTPARRLIPPEREHLQPRYLTEREYKQLLEAVRHEPRDAAIIELLLQTGLRLSELARLKITDVELPVKITKEPEHVGAVHIYDKGRKARTVTLNWKACKAIKTYLSVRPADTDDPHLFLTKFKLGIGPRSIENVVSKYLEEAGIRGASVHSLRHTFGTHTVKRGTKLRVVQEVLGQASLKTTSLYVQLAREDMDRQLQEHAAVDPRRCATAWVRVPAAGSARPGPGVEALERSLYEAAADADKDGDHGGNEHRGSHGTARSRDRG